MGSDREHCGEKPLSGNRAVHKGVPARERLVEVLRRQNETDITGAGAGRPGVIATILSAIRRRLESAMATTELGEAEAPRRG
jgi:hypothetical protein